MKKQKWLLLLVMMLATLLLCGCSQYDDNYEDVDFLTDGLNHYAATMWFGRVQTDGTYALHAGSFSGVHGLRSFTVEKDGAMCEVISTLVCTRGEAKLLVVDTKEKSIVAQWPLGNPEPMSVTLPAGSYDLRIAGKSAGFQGEIGLTLNGRTVSRENMLEAVQDVMREAMDGLRQAA